MDRVVEVVAPSIAAAAVAVAVAVAAAGAEGNDAARPGGKYADGAEPSAGAVMVEVGVVAVERWFEPMAPCDSIGKNPSVTSPNESAAARGRGGEYWWWSCCWWSC
jgi:hypothetical protein